MKKVKIDTKRFDKVIAECRKRIAGRQKIPILNFLKARQKIINQHTEYLKIPMKSLLIARAKRKKLK